MSVLTEEQVAVYMDPASSDIKFLLDKEDVDRLTQARLYEAGVLSVKQFAVLCKDVEEMRETAVKELGFEMKTLKDKAKLSMLLVAFAKALRTPDYQGMREAYEKKLWEIEDRKVPSRACVAKKLESVEKNDLKVEALTEVTNTRDDEGSESFEPNWDPQGGLVAVRKTAKVGLPQTAEDFRYRVTLMGHCWSFVAIHTRTESTWPRSTRICGRTTWITCWRSRCKNVMKGEDLAIVLRTSWADPIVKEKFFTTPLCWEVIDTAKRRPDSQQEYPPKAPRTESCDNGKGQGKGKMTKG